MKADKIKKPSVAYVTKRVLLGASRKAMIAASDKAMRIIGYVVKAENGWIVRQNIDGTIKQVKKLSPKVKAKEVILD